MKKIVVVMIFFCLVFVGCVSATEYYVDGNNKGGKGCNNSWIGTKDAPLCTISEASFRMVAGDSVYIREGIYRETIIPLRSGDADDNRITYTNYADEEVTITGVNHGADLVKNNNIYITLDGLRMVNTNKRWVNLSYTSGSHDTYINIQNCFFDGVTAESWYTGIYVERAHHNKLLNNELDDGECTTKNETNMCQPPDQDCGSPYDLVRFKDSNYNLIEGNVFHDATHTVLGMGERAKYNVVRNNTFDTRWHSALYYHNTVPVSGTGGPVNLAENNVFINNGREYATCWCCSGHHEGDAWAQGGIAHHAGESIIRNNVVYGYGQMMSLSPQNGRASVYNRVYHNTAYQTYRGISATDPVNDSVADNIVKNNIIYDVRTDGGYPNGMDAVVTSSIVSHYRFFNNNIDPSKTRFTLKNDIKFWDKNINKNPLFVNTGGANFYLQSNSPMIDAGGWLTNITSSTGSGKTFTVQDARYFMDGWGIIEGDEIQLQGQTKIVRIKNITQNTITVNETISWTQGLGVSLPYSGTAPDIGAFEYIGTPRPPTVPENCTNGIDDDGDLKIDCDDSDCFSRPTCQKPTAEFYKILKTNKTMIINGDISEFNGAEEIELRIPERETIGKYKLMWDNSALYISANVSDDELNYVVTTRDGSGIWNDDSIELFFDIGNNKTGLMDLDDYKFFVNINNTQMDYQGIQGNGWNISFNSAVMKTFNSGYLIEIAIPWRNWGISLSNENKTMGFDLTMNDRIANGTRYDTIWNNSDGGTPNNPSGWGEIVFSSEIVPSICSVGLSDINEKMSDWQSGKCKVFDVIALIRQWVAAGKC